MRSRAQQAYLRGRRVENLIGLCYRLAGWRRRQQRWRNPYHEIDLILQRGKRILFIEVKFRRNSWQFNELISPAEQIKLWQAAQLWQQRFGQASYIYDFVAVYIGPQLWQWRRLPLDPMLTP